MTKQASRSVTRLSRVAALAGRVGAVARGGVSWFRGRWPWPPGAGNPGGRSRRRPGSTNLDAALRSGEIASTHFARPEMDVARWSADEGLAALARALTDSEPAARAAALAAVAELSRHHAAFAVGAALRDPEPFVRTVGANAANRVRGMRVIASLIASLADPEPEVRRAIASAIRELTGQPVTLVEPGARVSEEQMSALRAWWKERRLAELAAEASGASDR